MKGIQVFWFGLIILALAGCRVSYSLTGADIPAQAQTFSIKKFQNLTPQASTNYDLRITESLKDLLLAQTRLDLVEQRGDLQFEGLITQYETSNAAVSGEEFTTLNRLTISVKVKYINTFEREKNFDKTFTRFADYSSTQDFSQVENDLIININDQLTQDIFDASIGAW